MREEFKNLFEAASAISKKQAAAQEEQAILHGSDLHKSDLHKSDVDSDFQSCQDKYHDLNASLDAVFRINEIDPHNFRQFLSQPQNFSQQEWHDIQEGKQNVKVMIQELETQVKQVQVPPLEKEQVKELDQAKELGKEQAQEQESEAALSSQKETNKSQTLPAQPPSSQTPLAQTPKPSKSSKGAMSRRRQWLDMH